MSASRFYEIGKLLEKRLSDPLEDGTVFYLDPRDSDRKVAEELGVKAASVQNVRRGSFGNLKLSQSTKTKVSTRDMVRTLIHKHNLFVRKIEDIFEIDLTECRAIGDRNNETD